MRDTRTAIVARNLRKYLPSSGKIRALAFCNTVAHARYTADHLQRDHKVEAVSLTGESDALDRVEAIRRLRDENDPLEVICTVDIFNEGIDIPELSHVLFLRPTQSFTIFLQQLGRGLRKAPEKDFHELIGRVESHECQWSHMSLLEISHKINCHKEVLFRCLAETPSKLL